MAARVNPRRIPRTQHDDKHDAPTEDVQQLAKELNHAAQCVSEGYVSWSDIGKMLKEYDVEVELV